MTMMQRLSLLLLLLVCATTTTTAIETHMGKRYHPFDSPLSAYGNYEGQDADKKIVSNRRKADAIVDARLEKMKTIAMKKRAREMKKEQGMKKDVFNSEEMEALFMYTDYM